MSPSRNKICVTLRIRAGDQFACAFAARVKKCWWEMRAYCELATKIDDLMVALIQVPVPATATTADTSRFNRVHSFDDLRRTYASVHPPMGTGVQHRDEPTGGKLVDVALTACIAFLFVSAMLGLNALETAWQLHP